MKVSELSGALLDYWAVKADGSKGAGYHYQDDAWHATDCGVPVFYSRRWEQGGPIIDRERIALFPAAGDAGVWMAQLQTDSRSSQFGPTALVAAMRCFVWSKYGDEVPA